MAEAVALASLLLSEMDDTDEFEDCKNVFATAMLAVAAQS